MPTREPESMRISDRETLEWSSEDSQREQKSRDDLERVAHWLDTVFEIPVLGWRFGIDAVLGLIPGVGDTASTLASIYVLQAATKFGISRFTLARMTLNIVVDLIVGSIPLLGDFFDVYWKANRRNVELLRRHLAASPAAQRKLNRADTTFVVGMIAVIVLVFVASIATALYILNSLLKMIAGT